MNNHMVQVQAIALVVLMYFMCVDNGDKPEVCAQTMESRKEGHRP